MRRNAARRANSGQCPPPPTQCADTGSAGLPALARQIQTPKGERRVHASGRLSSGLSGVGPDTRDRRTVPPTDHRRWSQQAILLRISRLSAARWASHHPLYLLRNRHSSRPKEEWTKTRWRGIPLPGRNETCLEHAVEVITKTGVLSLLIVHCYLVIVAVIRVIVSNETATRWPNVGFIRHHE